MYGMLLLLHVLGATIWTGGHIVLATIVLPKALRQQSPEVLLDFEGAYERIGMPALLVQIATGIALASHHLPEVSRWFDISQPKAHPIQAKLLLLAITAGFAAHAKLRVLPDLNAQTLRLMAWHILAVTACSILFVVAGVSFRTGWLY